MGNDQIPQNLINKYGEDILRGLAAADHRRQEYKFNHSSADRRQESITLYVETPQAGKLGEVNKDAQPGEIYENVKIWPLVMLAAIRNNSGGAARLWFVAKSLDPDGSGKVSQVALFDYLSEMGIGDRKRQRWVKQALNLGLLRVAPGHYWLAGWGRGAGMLGASQVGKPAMLPTRSLLFPGWRAKVWAAYLATLEGRILSQETKYKLTGVDPRTQRNYQSQLPIKRMQNYSNIDQKRDYLEGHIFHNPKIKKEVQRLPDILVMPSEVARSLPKGRSRKAQGELNSRILGEHLSNPVAGANSGIVRIFHETLKGASKAIRKAEFGEVFYRKHTWENANQWGAVVQL